MNPPDESPCLHLPPTHPLIPIPYPPQTPPCSPPLVATHHSPPPRAPYPSPPPSPHPTPSTASPGCSLVLALNTHCHADHITGTGALKRHFPRMRSAIAQSSGALADTYLTPNETISWGGGRRSLKCLATPGHTDGCVSFYDDSIGAVFTGDALLIGGCGRTDFQGGSSTKLYESVHSQIFTLPGSTLVLPAHDYKVFYFSTQTPISPICRTPLFPISQNLILFFGAGAALVDCADGEGDQPETECGQGGVCQNNGRARAGVPEKDRRCRARESQVRALKLRRHSESTSRGSGVSHLIHKSSRFFACEDILILIYWRRFFFYLLRIYYYIYTYICCK